MPAPEQCIRVIMLIYRSDKNLEMSSTQLEQPGQAMAD